MYDAIAEMMNREQTTASPWIMRLRRQRIASQYARDDDNASLPDFITANDKIRQVWQLLIDEYRKDALNL